MATPPTVPAGWYTDPAARHERRYWDGTDWTSQVSDGGVTGTDQPGFRPPPVPQAPAEPPPAATSAVPAASAVPSAVRRGRRRWAVAAIAAVAVLGLIAGLVIWAPWKSPPLLRPTGLVAGPSTTGSVAFSWSRPATGPAPDRYVIRRDGKVMGSVPGTVTSYHGTGLAPATAYRYRVAAERGGKRSAPSSVLVVSTSTPPISAARLQGQWTVSIKITKGFSSFQDTPRTWDETWLVSPKCAAGPCNVRLSGGINGFTFKTTLVRAGAVYRGKIIGNVFPCGSGSASFPIRTTVRIRIAVTGAHVDNRAWTARSWAGHMVLTAPYTASGSIYCPASLARASLSA
jgi:Protein of unknown function (DUF2510)/Fibronectin type III domain